MTAVLGSQTCARPTWKYPNGRTGTANGYQAHRRADEYPCEQCAAAWRAKMTAYNRSVPESEKRRRTAKATVTARTRREATQACTVVTPEFPDGRKGTVGGYLAHISDGQTPCVACMATASEFQPLCSRPTVEYPDGRTGTRSGYHSHVRADEKACGPCLEGAAREEAKARADDDPERTLRGNLWSRFRMSLEQYSELLESQGNACAICGVEAPRDIRSSRFHVDHDHACCPGRGRTCGNCNRGLLCHACNTALGNFGDDPERMRRAIEYLLEHKATGGK